MYLVAEKEIENEAKEFRYGVPPDVYSEWRVAAKRIGLPQTQIIHRLVRFLLDHDDVTQGIILGTVRPSEDLIELVLRRERKKKAKFGARTGLTGTKTNQRQERPADDIAKPRK